MRWFLYLHNLLRRTPDPTATTQRQTGTELVRGLWETWSSCCSSHCTCPRRLNDHRSLLTRQRNPPPTHSLHSSMMGKQKRRRTAVVKSRQHKDTRRSWQTHTLVPIPVFPIRVLPPAKNTRPDGNDAAANPNRACPRPLGNLVQLLLVALYMST